MRNLTWNLPCTRWDEDLGYTQLDFPPRIFIPEIKRFLFFFFFNWNICVSLKKIICFYYYLFRVRNHFWSFLILHQMYFLLLTENWRCRDLSFISLTWFICLLKMGEIQTPKYLAIPIWGCLTIWLCVLLCSFGQMCSKYRFEYPLPSAFCHLWNVTGMAFSRWKGYWKGSLTSAQHFEYDTLWCIYEHLTYRQGSQSCNQRCNTSAVALQIYLH